MSNIVKFGNANLPTAQDLAASLRKLDTVDSGPGVILKMDKTGHWVYGADQTEIDREGTWAINPLSFVHGYIAWGEGEVLGEHMFPIHEELPEMDPPPPNAKRGWESQFGVSLKCLSGDDKNVEARFATTSVGGKKAMQSLALRVSDQLTTDAEKPVPLVKLGSDHYQHKSYGRVFTPVFEIIDWVSLNGPVEETTDTGRRRRG